MNVKEIWLAGGCLGCSLFRTNPRGLETLVGYANGDTETPPTKT